MSLPVAFRAEAEEEFDRAIDWYEDQRVGLGELFAEEMQVALDLISQQPKRFVCVFKDVRKAPLRRFPYRIFYRLTSNNIEVIAVFHTSRDPDAWKSRVE